MQAIYRKELKIFFGSPFGYLITALLLFFMGLFVALYNLMTGSGEMSYALSAMQWVLIVTIPLLCMRSLAEERHNRTDQLLFSLPISVRDVVLGKYLSLLTLFLLPTGISALYPLILSSLGNVSLPACYVAFLGYVLMANAMIALCMFASSLTESRILAAVIGVALMLGVYFIDLVAELIPSTATVSFVICLLAAVGLSVWFWYSCKQLTLALILAALLILPTSILFVCRQTLFVGLVPNFLDRIDLFSRMGGFLYGRLDLGGVLFYLSFAAFFLLLTVQSMEKRRRA